jgi:hypothetical protein
MAGVWVEYCGSRNAARDLSHGWRRVLQQLGLWLSSLFDSLELGFYFVRFAVLLQRNVRQLHSVLDLRAGARR